MPNFLRPEADGTLRSTVFPGLWLDPEALLRNDLDRLLDVLQRGIDSPEHARFKSWLMRQSGEAAAPEIAVAGGDLGN